jgi:hypothetical protein
MRIGEEAAAAAGVSPPIDAPVNRTTLSSTAEKRTSKLLSLREAKQAFVRGIRSKGEEAVP